jgi:hypothetical protein
MVRSVFLPSSGVSLYEMRRGGLITGMTLEGVEYEENGDGIEGLVT